MPSTKAKVAVALGALDIARQLARAHAATHEVKSERFHHLPDVDWGRMPWRHQPTPLERSKRWAPAVGVLMVVVAGIAAIAAVVARHEPDADADEVMSDHRVAGAVRAGGKAVERGVATVVEGGTAAAVGTASTVAATTAAVREAAVAKARHEVDERVVQPVKRKVTIYGALGALGITVYVIIVAAATHGVVAWLT